MAKILKVRKTLVSRETLVREIGREAEVPVQTVIAAVVLENPWAGEGYVADLVTDIHALAPDLGALLTDALAELIDPATIEAYGKAALVGLDGELEHASALIHTLRFGNVFRERVGGTSFLPFTNSRASAGTRVQIPLVHTKDSGIRSHYLTADFSIIDAPMADELLIAIAASSSGRPFARIGDRYEDMAAMSAETPEK